MKNQEGKEDQKFPKREKPLNKKMLEVYYGWMNLIKFRLGVSEEEDEKIFQSRRLSDSAPFL